MRKTIKKGIALLISIAIILSLIPVSLIALAAQEEPTVRVSNVYGRAGETVTVSVTMSENSYACGGNFNLVYDNNMLQAVSASCGDLAAGMTPIANPQYDADKVRFTFAGITPITKFGTLVTVSFKILDNAEGTIPLTLEKVNLYNSNSEHLIKTVEHGSIIVDGSFKVPTLSVGSYNVESDEELTVNVGITELSQVCGGNFNFVYDNTKLEIIEATQGSLLNGFASYINTEYSDNVIRMSFAGVNPITEAGSVLNIKFRIISEESGTAAIALENSRLYDGDGKFISHSHESGEVNIKYIPPHIAKLSVQKVTGYTCGNVTIAVQLAKNSGVCGGNFTLKYDNSKMTLKSAVIGEVINDRSAYVNPDYADNKIRVSFAGTEPITDAGDVVILTFTLSDDSEGVNSLTLSDARVYDANGEAVLLNCYDGFVDVVNNGATSGDYSYIVKDGKVTITAYLGADENVSVPQTINGKPVVAIGDSAFRNCAGIKNVSIPEGVVSIENNAFSNCVNLEKISLAESVATIGEKAFFGCNILNRVELTRSVTSIGDYAFGYLYGTTKNENFAILGYEYTVAHDYANANEIRFIFLDEYYRPTFDVTATANEENYTFGEWTKGTVTITLTNTSEYDGEVEYFYSIDGGEFTSFNGTLEVTDSGSYEYSFMSRNDIGRESEISDVFDIKVDNDIPAISAITITPEIETINPVNISFTSSDYHSGISKVCYDNNELTIENGKYNLTVSANGTYSFVIIDNAGNEYVFEQTIDNIIVVAPPTAVENFFAAGDMMKISLAWSTAIEYRVSGYELYRAESENGEFALISSIDGRSTTRYEDKKVELGKTYFYKIIAVDIYGQKGEEGTIVSATVLSDTSAPTTKNLAAMSNSYLSDDVLSGTVVFRAEAEDNVSLDSILFSYSVDGGETYQDIGLNPIENNYSVIDFDTTRLSDGVVRIKACAVDGAGNYGNQIIREYVIDNTGPEKVNLYSYESVSTTITLKWTDVKDTDFSHFIVEQFDDNTGEYKKITTVYSTLGANVTGLIPDNEYKFRVVAFDKYGNKGTYSDELITRTKTDKISPVINKQTPEAGYFNGVIPFSVVVMDDYSVKSVVFQTSYDSISWTDYKFVACEDISSSLTVSCDIDTTSFEEGFIYIRAIATDYAGNESDTSVDTAPYVQYYVDRKPPLPVEGITVTASEGSVEVSWADSDDFIAEYNVLRSVGESTEYEIVATDITNLNWFDYSIQEGEKYNYKVVAIDAAGNASAESVPVSIVIDKSVFEDKNPPVIQLVTPYDGDVVGGSAVRVSSYVTDNIKIEKFRVEVKDSLLSIYNTVKEVNNVSARSYTDICDISLEDYSDGDVLYIKLTSIDAAGNESDSVKYKYTVDKKAPEISAVEAEAKDNIVTVKWSTAEDCIDVDCYSIYRKSATENTFVFLAETAVSINTSFVYTDRLSATNDGNYIYKVVAVDKAGNSAYSLSNEVYYKYKEPDSFTNGSFENDYSPVNKAPRAVIVADAFAEEKVEYLYKGSMSYDDDKIEVYSWDFGDGTFSNESDPIHIYNEPGIYEVALTVYDSENLFSSDSFTVNVAKREVLGSCTVTVVDEKGSLMIGMPVFFNLGNDDMSIKYTDNNGKVSFIASEGTYVVGAYKDGFLPSKTSVSIKRAADSNATLSVVEKDIVSGSFEVERMTLDEIIAAGIDVNDPDNRHIVKINVRLKYSKVSKNISCYYNPVTQETRVDPGKPGRGFILPPYIPPYIPPYGPNSPNDDDGDDFSPFNPEGYDYDGHSSYCTAEPIVDENGNIQGVAIFDIPVEATFLKEFFDVKLHIINNADSDFALVNNEVKLHIPEGLTLMKEAIGYSNSTDVSFDSLYGQQTKTISWVLRGDVKGEYDLSADYSAVLKDFNVNVNRRFVTEEPIKVYGTDAAEMFIVASELMEDNKILFDCGIHNKSDIDIYLPDIYIVEDEVKDYEVNFLNKLHVKSDGSAEYLNVKDGLLVLKPGESLYAQYELIYTKQDFGDDKLFLSSATFWYLSEAKMDVTIQRKEQETELTKVKQLNISEGINEISPYVYTLNGLVSVIVNNKNARYTSENGMLYSKDKTKLVLYPSQKPLEEGFVILNTVESISTGAFYGRDDWSYMFVPEHVTSLEERAVGFAYESMVGHVADKNLIICCYTDSAAHRYAMDNGIRYILVDGGYGMHFSSDPIIYIGESGTAEMIYVATTYSPNEIIFAVENEDVATIQNYEVLESIVPGMYNILVHLQSVALGTTNLVATLPNGATTECIVFVTEKPVVKPYDPTDDDMVSLALSKLVYANDLENHKGEYVISMGYGDEEIWEDSKVYWSDLYSSYLAGYKLIHTKRNPKSGFFAGAFYNEENNKLFISYEGSTPVDEIFSDLSDAWSDWIENDAEILFHDAITPQLREAVEMLDESILRVKSDYERDPNIVLTGHSLGGGLAMFVSALEDLRAHTFNALFTLDTAYYHLSPGFAENFYGTNGWKCIDHVNPTDLICGMRYIDRKTTYVHADNDGVMDFSSHTLPSILCIKSGRISLTNYYVEYAGLWEESVFNTHSDKQEELIKDMLLDLPDFITSAICLPKAIYKLVQYIIDFIKSFTNLMVLGTLYTDSIEGSPYLSFYSNRDILYGGNGNDSIDGFSDDDIIIGGKGDDDISGGSGDDLYVYYKGDGHDIIVDDAGDDRVLLMGFTPSDKIICTKYPGGRKSIGLVQVKCNNEKILTIAVRDSLFGLFPQEMVLELPDLDKTITIDISNEASLKNPVDCTIACPVEVKIYSPENELLAHLTNTEEQRIFTRYGSFYTVFDDESEEYYKFLSCVDSRCRVEIVGVGNGEMSVLMKDSVGETAPINYCENIPINVEDELVFDLLNRTIVQGELIYDLKEKSVIQMQNFKLSEEQITLEIGDIYQLIPDIYPSNATVRNVTWESSDKSVVKVNENGEIVAQSTGEAVVTVRLNDIGFSDQCSVMVTEKVSSPEHLVTWVIDGVETTQTYTEGAAIVKPSDPIKSDYKFMGWTPDVPETMPEYDLTFTAVFEKSYTCPDCGDEILGEDEINEHIAAEAIMKATIKIKNNNGSNTIKYGETLRLTAIITNMPADAKIYWYIEGEKKGEGEIFNVSFENGTKTVEVKIVDSNGNVLKNAIGDEIKDFESVTVKGGFFQKIISFFKNLFRMNRTVVQAIFKGTL